MLEEGVPTPGTMISEFRITRKLGMGGCGIVFEAFQERLNREVAVKVLLPSAAARIDDLAKRFLREIDLCRRLEHPNIVRLYDYGQTDGGLLWMAMELVRGVDLTRIMHKEKKIPVPRARKIMLQVLSALAEAHTMGVVHRDLKPGNIMLTQKGADRDVVKLLDFGIGKALGEGENAAIQDLTMEESSTVGTPRYMAPELLTRDNVGPQADVYAAGLILLEMLTGQRAVQGDSTFQILANQINKALEVPKEIMESELGPIIEISTHKSWEVRYPSALEFHAALSGQDDEYTRQAMETGRLRAVRADSEPVDMAMVTGELLEDMGEIEIFDQDSLEISAPVSLALTEPQPESSKAWVWVLLVVLLGAGAATFGYMSQSGQAPAEPAQANAGDTPANTNKAVASDPASTTDNTNNAGDETAGETAGAETAVDETAAAEPATAENGSEPEEPAKLEPPAPVTWSFETDPPGAAVSLGDAQICEATPCEVALDTADAEAEVVFALADHTEIRKPIVPNAPGVLSVQLVKSPEAVAEARDAKKRRDRRKDKPKTDTPKKDPKKDADPFEMKSD